MITSFLVKKATKGNTDYMNKTVRLKIGYLGSIVGVAVVLVMFAKKLAIGLFTSSIAILAEAFNN